MMSNPYEVKEQVMYRANPSLIQTIRGMKENLHSVGKQLIGRTVRIETMDGQRLEGIVANVDRGILYLQIFPGPYVPRQFYNPIILPLVLYELLVITLLYT